MFREDILLSILHAPTFGIHVNKAICHKDIRLTTHIEWSAHKHRRHLPVLLLHLQTQSGSWTRVKELSGCCTHTCLLNLCENNSFCILSVLCNKHNFTYSNTMDPEQKRKSFLAAAHIHACWICVKIIVSASFLSYATNTISHIPIPSWLSKNSHPATARPSCWTLPITSYVHQSSSHM